MTRFARLLALSTHVSRLTSPKGPTMLDYDLSVPANATDGAPVIVLLHGRGSNKGDLMGLRPGLPPDAIVVTPQAPFPGAQWGYGGGWAWYQFLGGTIPEPETFLAGQTELENFL